jgi:hypothetical protein
MRRRSHFVPSICNPLLLTSLPAPPHRNRLAIPKSTWYSPLSTARMLRDVPAFRTNLRDDQGKAVMGNTDNFWIWTKESGFDLTHPLTPESKPVEPRIKMKFEMTPITIDPTKTALLIIDYQNYNISRALGNNV